MPDDLLGMTNLAAQIEARMGAELRGILREAGALADGMGFRVYGVGGMVRDLLLGRGNFDLDIVVEGEGIRFAKGLAGRLLGRVKAYERFGTATITVQGGVKVDVATARTEIYDEPAVLPRVTRGSIHDDLFRRDFTVNAMAVALAPAEYGRLLDEFGGVRDIREQCIRVLHDRSFFDDPTRIFRAVRFETRLGFRIFGSDEGLIGDALSQSLLEKLEEYRIAAELRLILGEPEPARSLRRLAELGVIGALEGFREKRGLLKKPLAKINKVLQSAR